MSKTVRNTWGVRLNEVEKKQLAEISEQRGKNRGEVIRELIAEEWRRLHESPAAPAAGKGRPRIAGVRR